MEVSKDTHEYKEEYAQMRYSFLMQYAPDTVEEKYGHISGGACGNKRVIKKFNKLYCNIYKYYGVTEEDIRNKSERYEELIHTLAR